MFCISNINKDAPELVSLVSELDAFQSQLYPAESDHSLDLSTVSDEDLRCLIVKNKHGISVGCGALLFQEEGHCEVKRIYVRPAFRGRQLGEQIVASLEKIAQENHCRQLRLETGIHQQSAIALYRRCGYEVCEAFPPYLPDPLSVFMCKRLQPNK